MSPPTKGPAPIASRPVLKSGVATTDNGKVSKHVCLKCGEPAVWTSPTGHSLCQSCRELIGSIADDIWPSQHRFEPLDLDSLMAMDPTDESFLVEPLLPLGKQVGIVARRGDGKSLLFLEVAVKKATGEAVLDQPPGVPISVVYLDMEMGPADLYDRLVDLGFDRDHSRWQTLVEHLHYYQLVALPALNTEAGGEALQEIVDRHKATLVVIDTLSRVITGSENDAEPFQDLFRYTEARLKARGITVARLDHFGKDVGRGSRGSSAKEDALDVIWEMTVNATGSLQLAKTKGRSTELPDMVTIHREVVDGVLCHRTETELAPVWLVDLADELDRVGVPIEAGSPTAQRLLREAGVKKRRADIVKAVRFRKRRHLGTPPEHSAGTPTGTGRNTSTTTPEVSSLFDREHPPEHPGTGRGGVFPSYRGNTPDAGSSEEEMAALVAFGDRRR